MALHKVRGGQLFSHLMQPLYGVIGVFTFGSDKCVAFPGFEIKNGVQLNQINRAVDPLTGSLRMIASMVFMAAPIIIINLRRLGSLYRQSVRVFFLRNQPNAHRIPIVFSLVGFDTGDDHNNQAEDHKSEDEKKPDEDENQKNRDQSVNYQGDLKVEGFFGLINNEFGFIFL